MSETDPTTAATPEPFEQTTSFRMEPPAGLHLPCPHCGQQEATITLTLGDGAFQCQECNAEIERSEIANFIHQWSKLLAWCDQMPND